MKRIATFILLILAVAATGEVFAGNIVSAAGYTQGMAWSVGAPLAGQYMGRGVNIYFGDDSYTYAELSGIENVVTASGSISIVIVDGGRAAHVEADGAWAWQVTAATGIILGRGTGEGTDEISLTHLCTGAYIVTVATANGSTNSSIVIKK